MKYNFSEIAKNGLILSLISIIILLANQFITSKIPSLSILFWIIKFGGCIYLLYFFMKQHASANSGITYKQSANYGSLVSVFSAIAIGAYLTLHYYVIVPNAFSEAVETWLQLMAEQGMDMSSSLDIDTLESNFPIYAAVGQIIYCSLFGLLASSIIANWTKDNTVKFDNLEQE